MRHLVTLAAVVVMLTTLPGCEDRAEALAAGGGGILLLAAASTVDSVTELAALYEQETGVTVRVSTAGSNALASQILSGVPGDVFLSASVEWAQAVQQQGLAIEMRPLLNNRLVIVVPRGNPAKVATPADLLRDDVRRVALAGENVPAGRYAEQALRHAGLYDALMDRNRIARGENVRLALGYVTTGEAEAGIVYATDARASDQVEVACAFPPDSHEPIVYPLVLIKSPTDGEAGRLFYQFLSGDRAAAVFEKYGFSPAPPSDGVVK